MPTDLFHRDTTRTIGIFHDKAPEVGVCVHRCEPSGKEIVGCHESVYSARIIAEENMGASFQDLSTAWAQWT